MQYSRSLGNSLQTKKTTRAENSVGKQEMEQSEPPFPNMHVLNSLLLDDMLILSTNYMQQEHNTEDHDTPLQLSL